SPDLCRTRPLWPLDAPEGDGPADHGAGAHLVRPPALPRGAGRGSADRKTPTDMSDRIITKVGEELAHYQRIKAALAGDDVDPVALLDTLEGETELHEALLAVADSIQEDEDMAAAIKVRLDALQARKSRLEATAETKRNIILMAMERAE